MRKPSPPPTRRYSESDLTARPRHRKPPQKAADVALARVDALAHVPPCPWDETELATALGITLLRAGILWSYLHSFNNLHERAKALRDALRENGIPYARSKAIVRAWRDKCPLAVFLAERKAAWEAERAYVDALTRTRPRA